MQNINICSELPSFVELHSFICCRFNFLLLGWHKKLALRWRKKKFMIFWCLRCTFLSHLCNILHNVSLYVKCWFLFYHHKLDGKRTLLELLFINQVSKRIYFQILKSFWKETHNSGIRISWNFSSFNTTINFCLILIKENWIFKQKKLKISQRWEYNWPFFSPLCINICFVLY